MKWLSANVLICFVVLFGEVNADKLIQVGDDLSPDLSPWQPEQQRRLHMAIKMARERSGYHHHDRRKMMDATNIIFEQAGGIIQKLGGDGFGSFNFGFETKSSADGKIVIVGDYAASIVTDNITYFEDVSFVGQAFVFKMEDDGSWTQLGQTFTGDINTPFDFFGWRVAISSAGDRISITGFGARGNDVPVQAPGYLRLYDFNPETEMWDSIQNITGPPVNSTQLGIDLAMSGAGDRVVVALLQPERLRIYHYDESVGEFMVKAELPGRNPDPDAFDFFGFGIGMSKNGMFVATGGSFADTPPLNNTGYARAYRYNKKRDKWFQVGQDIVRGADQQIGISSHLSADGKRWAFGSFPGFDADDLVPFGKVFVYDLVDGNKWKQVGQTLKGFSVGGRFGWRVTLSSFGNRIAVGAYRDGQSRSGPGELGRVYVYDLINGSWELAYTLEGDQQDADFGWVVSFAPSGEGKKLLVASRFEDDKEFPQVSGRVRLFKEVAVDSPIQLKFFNPATNAVVPFANGNKVDLCNVMLDQYNNTKLSVEAIVDGHPEKVVMKLFNATTMEILYKNTEDVAPYTLGGDIDPPKFKAFPVEKLITDGMVKLFVRAVGVGRKTFTFDVKPCIQF